VPLKLDFRIADETDIMHFDKENYDYDRKAKDYCLKRLKHCDRCILALYNNEIVGICG